MNTKKCTPAERKVLKRLARKSRRQTGLTMYQAERQMVQLFQWAYGDSDDRPSWLPDPIPTHN